MRGYGAEEKERQEKEKTQWKLRTIKQCKHYKEEMEAETIEKT